MIPHSLLSVLLLVAAVAQNGSDTAATSPATHPARLGESAPGDPVEGGVDWKQKVLDRAGIEAWDDVKRLQFTFNVERPDGQKTSVQHDWNLETGVDTVTWDGKTVPVNVWSFDPEQASEDEKAAFRRWTNDSYWLMAPLKIDDPGCTVVTLGPGEINGQTYTMLRLSFEEVGLTPGDRYVLYVDDDGLVRYWDYMPNPDRKVTWSWEGYENFGGLTLATKHEPQGEGPRITFTEIVVETAETQTRAE